MPSRDDGARIDVLESAPVLNEGILRNAHLSTEAPDISVRVLLSARIDRKDSFPKRLFLADGVVLTDPARLHLPADEHEVIAVPAEWIRSGRAISHAYRRLDGTFTLENDTVVEIWKRTEAVRPAAKRELRRRLERDL